MPDAYTPSSPSTKGTGAPKEDAPVPVYNPTEKEKKIISEVDNFFTDKRRDRQNHEPQWYINSAFFRGNQNVSWNSVDNRLVNPPVINPNRQRRQINRIFAKVRARRAKFLKNRPTWVIVPATTDIKDTLDAKATGKVLDYIWRKVHLESKYRDVVELAETCSRGYWWMSWDPEALGRVAQDDPTTGKKTTQEGVVGEVTVEVGSPFEVLVGNPGASSLIYQDEIMRVKERSLDYIRGRYPEKGKYVTSESTKDVFHYEQQIAALSTNTGLFSGTANLGMTRQKDIDGNPTTATVKEYFKRPTHSLPKGKYCVVANGILLKEEDLPFGFWDLANPFPCVDFADVTSAGQYWGTTVLEQYIEPQREYNGVRTMISTQIKLMGHPKVFVAQQHQIPEGAWTPDGGEIITYTARPGIEKPYTWQPPNIIGDAWRILELLKSEFDDLSQIYPSAEGKSGQSQSGYQTNLLQEASNDVHAPDIRAHELAIEEAAFKIRRIIKRGYTVPRLVTVTSASYAPEVFEFSAEDVDEYADIVVQAGSALPTYKGAKIQVALDLYAKGLLGDPKDPQVRKKTLAAIDMGSMGELTDYAATDDAMVDIENSSAEDGEVPLAEPRFFENHQQHWAGHISKLKSPAVMGWPTQNRMGLLSHAILHAKYINHASAFQMSIEAGLNGLIPPPPPPPMLPPGAVPPGQGAPSAGPPPGPTAQPAQSFQETQSQVGTNMPTAQGANPAS